MSVLINPTQTPAPLLTKQRIAVSDIGATVRLTVGNSHLDMPYETALQLSAWLRLHAKMAKRTAGDTGRRWNVIGVLEDANKAR